MAVVSTNCSSNSRRVTRPLALNGVVVLPFGTSPAAISRATSISPSWVNAGNRESVAVSEETTKTALPEKP